MLVALFLNIIISSEIIIRAFFFNGLLAVPMARILFFIYLPMSIKFINSLFTSQILLLPRTLLSLLIILSPWPRRSLLALVSKALSNKLDFMSHFVEENFNDASDSRRLSATIACLGSSVYSYSPYTVNHLNTTLHCCLKKNLIR